MDNNYGSSAEVSFCVWSKMIFYTGSTIHNKIIQDHFVVIHRGCLLQSTQRFIVRIMKF